MQKTTLNLAVILGATLLAACGDSKDSTSGNNSITPVDPPGKVLVPAPAQPSAAETAAYNADKQGSDHMSSLVGYDISIGDKVIIRVLNKTGRNSIEERNLGSMPAGLSMHNAVRNINDGPLSIFKDPVTVRSYQGFRSGVVTAYHTVAAPHATAYGVHTSPVNLPNTGKATYTGIAFDATTSGNFVYNVDFGAKTGQGRIENMSYGKGLITLDTAPFQQERRLNGSITTKLEGTGIDKTWGDFKYRLDFYGNQAEEIAGYALRSGVDAIGLHGTRGAITQ